MHWNIERIKNLVEAFSSQQLPLDKWDHEAHLVVAVYFCLSRTSEEALVTLRNLIIQHNEAVGTPNSDSEGYHETMTQFWVWVVSSFIEESSGSSLEAVIGQLLKSNFAERGYPLKYYSKELLFSPEARKSSIAPDIAQMNKENFRHL